jgi:hypothetical protein
MPADDELTPAERHELDRLRYNALPEQVVAYAILRRAESMPPELVLRALAYLEILLQGSLAVAGNEVWSGFAVCSPSPQATARFRRRQALRQPFKANCALWPSRRLRMPRRARPRDARTRRVVVRRSAAQSRDDGPLPSSDDDPHDELVRQPRRVAA